MRRQKSSRLWAVLLSLCMVVGMLPAQAVAAPAERSGISESVGITASTTGNGGDTAHTEDGEEAPGEEPPILELTDLSVGREDNDAASESEEPVAVNDTGSTAVPGVDYLEVAGGRTILYLDAGNIQIFKDIRQVNVGGRSVPFNETGFTITNKNQGTVTNNTLFVRDAEVLINNAKSNAVVTLQQATLTLAEGSVNQFGYLDLRTKNANFDGVTTITVEGSSWGPGRPQPMTLAEARQASTWADTPKLTLVTGNGIRVPKDATLKVYDGWISAKTSRTGAAIGGIGDYGEAGKMYFYGGRVDATRPGNDIAYSAIIGGTAPDYSSRLGFQTIRIMGGYVNATNAGNGAAIGSGGLASEARYTHNPIYIFGGAVNAQAINFGAAAIGAGTKNYAGSIFIYGGDINAVSGGGAGIGGSTNRNVPTDGSAGGTTLVMGGTINAKGTTGIGSGASLAKQEHTYVGPLDTTDIPGAESLSPQIKNALAQALAAYEEYKADLDTEPQKPLTGPDKLTAQGTKGAGISAGTNGSVGILGGNVTATGTTGAGIGGGISPNGSSGPIVIGGNAEVTATSQWNAGIGGGPTGTVGDIAIVGGTVTAQGGNNGAGIGGGNGGTAGNITIEGGTVTAQGGANGAGIGGGNNSAGGNTNISGGTVTSTGGTNGGAGVGGGKGGESGNITINGDTDVTATGGTSGGFDNNGAGIGGGAGAGMGNGHTITIGPDESTNVTVSGSGSAADIGGGSGGTVGDNQITTDGANVQTPTPNDDPYIGDGNRPPADPTFDITGSISVLSNRVATTVYLIPTDDLNGDNYAELDLEQYNSFTIKAGAEDQRFTLTGVLPGSYQVRIVKAGYLTHFLLDLVVGEENIALTAVELIAGDLNGDGVINILDAEVVFNEENLNMTEQDEGYRPEVDLTGDGVINILDAQIVFEEKYLYKSTEDTQVNAIDYIS